MNVIKVSLALAAMVVAVSLAPVWLSPPGPAFPSETPPLISPPTPAPEAIRPEAMATPSPPTPAPVNPAGQSIKTPYGLAVVRWPAGSPPLGLTAASPALPAPSMQVRSTPIPVVAAKPLLAPAAPADPAAIASPAALALEAREASTEADGQSPSRNFHRAKSLQMILKNATATPARGVQVEACWLGRKLDDNSLHIAHLEEATLEVDPAASVERTFLCPVLFSNVNRYVLLHQKYMRGFKYDGWAVLVMDGRQIASGRGSGTAIDEMIQKRTPMLELLAEFKPEGRPVDAAAAP